MFLQYLSDYDYEAEYWPFVLRMETLVDGFVQEAQKRIERLDQAKSRDYFENCFAVCFSTDPKLLGPEWWGNRVPSIDWFRAFFDREFPFMDREARRRAAESRDPDRHEHSCDEHCDHEHCDHEHHDYEHGQPDRFNRARIRQCAHENEAFQQFLHRAGVEPDESSIDSP